MQPLPPLTLACLINQLIPHKFSFILFATALIGTYCFFARFNLNWQILGIVIAGTFLLFFVTQRYIYSFSFIIFILTTSTYIATLFSLKIISLYLLQTHHFATLITLIAALAINAGQAMQGQQKNTGTLI
jgi:hypothetical protein